MKTRGTTGLDLDAINRAGWRAGDVLMTGSSDGAIADEFISAIAGVVPEPNRAQWLDYGCGRGDFASRIREGGHDIAVVEPYGAPALVPGIRHYRSLEQIPESARFGIITCLEVIEHVQEPLTLLSDLRSRLAPGGILLVTTPNVGGLQARLMRGHWREARNPAHVHLFSHRSLTLLSKRAGFSQVEELPGFIGYGRRGIRRVLLFVLQMLGLGGGLRLVMRNE